MLGLEHNVALNQHKQLSGDSFGVGDSMGGVEPYSQYVGGRRRLQLSCDFLFKFKVYTLFLYKMATVLHYYQWD